MLGLLLRLILPAFVFAAMTQGATAKSPQRPKVIADASFVAGLIATPLPNYPAEAVEKKLSGRGVFELHFRPDGTVGEALTVLTTGHRLLDETARAALLQWRCKPGAQRSARMKMSFLDAASRDEVVVKPGGDEARGNLVYAAHPSYPSEARRQRQTGYGVFVLRFRPDGTVSDVVALKSTGSTILDHECLSTFRLWHCRPGAYTTIQVPIRFTMQGAWRR
jgi:TonB family protein